MLALVADFNPLRARADEVLQRGVQVQRVAHLVEIGHRHVGTQAHRAPRAVSGLGLGRVGGGRVGLVFAQDELEQCGLARAVGAQQADFVAAKDGGAEVSDDHAIAKGLAHMHHLRDQLAALVAAVDVHVHAAHHVAAGLAGRAQLLQPVDAGGGAGAAGFYALADPHLFLRQQLVSLGVDHCLLSQLLFLLREEGGKVARVAHEVAAVQLDDPGCHVVQKRAVVGDGDEAALKLHQQAFKPFNRVQVQVVGGLVQQQHIGLGYQRLRERHALFGAARQRVDHRIGVEVQALQGLRNPLLPVPAVQRFNFALHRVQVAVALAIFLNEGPYPRQSRADRRKHAGLSVK